uniref:Anaphase-promoting complex subunit 13 n=1 Tax=Elaeophora elaphi TaxID=1147741 RepID=A0A0R3RXI8_9BILA
MDLNVLSLECKKLEHAEVSTIQAEQLEQSTGDAGHGEAIPILLNLFSDEERAAPVLFDPRIMPGSPTPDQSRSDRRSIEEKLLRKREWKCAETLVAMTQRGVGKGFSLSTLEGIIDRNLENPVHRNKVAINCDKEVETEVPTDHRPCGRD